MRVTTGRLKGHCHLKGHLFKLGLIDSPECDRCKQVYETASLVGDCEALAVLRFSHLAHHFLKSGGFADISSINHFVQSAVLLYAYERVAQKMGNGRGAPFAAVPALMYSRFLENVWISSLGRK